MVTIKENQVKKLLEQGFTVREAVDELTREENQYLEQEDEARQAFEECNCEAI